MVLIGRTKFGQNNRISLVEGLPDIMDLELGDYLEFHVENGKLILRKETKKYNGFDFEGEEIEERLRELEQSKIDEYEDETIDPELAERRAREKYLQDKAEKEKKKKK